MSHEASAAAPMSPAHNGSTSSSNTSTPRASSLRPGPTLWVEMWESQRWYPVIGWGTSRFLRDLPTFCLVPAAYRLCGAHPPAFDAALEDANPVEPHTPDPQWAARSILKVALPPGYRWVGFWEVHKDHPHGTDSAGWRYGEQFLTSASDANGAHGQPGAPSKLAPFKKTHTPLCVVRRRLWRRRVALVAPEEAAPSPDDLFLGDTEQQHEAYLSEKQEEMSVAEHLKRQECMALAAGQPWSQEQEIIAEDELRRFCRERRSRESATRMRSANPSFANPFQHQAEGFHLSPAASPNEARAGGAPDGIESQFGGGAVAASTWARDGEPGRDTLVMASPIAGLEEAQEAEQHDDGGRRADLSSTDGVTFKASSPSSPSRVDGGDAASHNAVHHFVATTPGEDEAWHLDGAETARENTVAEFVAATPTEAAELGSDEPSTGVSVGGMGDPTGAEFRAIFSQFMDPAGEAKAE